MTGVSLISIAWPIPPLSSFTSYSHRTIWFLRKDRKQVPKKGTCNLQFEIPHHDLTARFAPYLAWYFCVSYFTVPITIYVRWLWLLRDNHQKEILLGAKDSPRKRYESDVFLWSNINEINASPLHDNMSETSTPLWLKKQVRAGRRFAREDDTG